MLALGKKDKRALAGPGGARGRATENGGLSTAVSIRQTVYIKPRG
jgi:hypothetical protein